MRTLTAALLYFAIVFGMGFVLGPIRVLALEPWLGNWIAVLCETPFLLATMWLASRLVPHWLGVETQPGAMLWMGLGGFVLVAAVEIIVGTVLRGVSLSEQFANLTTPGGQIYLALLGAFILMPSLAKSPWPRT